MNVKIVVLLIVSLLAIAACQESILVQNEKRTSVLIDERNDAALIVTKACADGVVCYRHIMTDGISCVTDEKVVDKYCGVSDNINMTLLRQASAELQKMRASGVASAGCTITEFGFDCKVNE